MKPDFLENCVHSNFAPASYSAYSNFVPPLEVCALKFRPPTQHIVMYTVYTKNPGRLWLAYIELQGDSYMLQFMSVDSSHFTLPELSPRWFDLHEIKNVSFYISGFK